MVGTDDLLSRLFLEEPRHCRHCSNSTVLANDDDEKALTFWHEKVGWIFVTLSQIQVYWRCPFMMFNWTLRKKYIRISQLQKDGDYRIVIFPTSQTKLRMEERFFLFIHRCLLARSLSTHIYRSLQFLQLPPSSEVPLYTYFYRSLLLLIRQRFRF